MLSPEAKGTLIKYPELFLLHYFPERVKVLKEFHLELINLAAFERRGLELYPATHGKTTLTSELMPVYEICKNPNVRIGALFKNDQDARAITRAIQSELQTNEKLIEDFGPFMPKNDAGSLWTQNRLDVANRTRSGKSSTWAAFGAGSRDALGYRTDWTLCDDIVTDKNSSTDTQRQSFFQWFMQGPMTMNDSPLGRMTVVGTAFDPRDLYHYLMAVKRPGSNDPMWVANIRKAILNWENEEVLWPEERPFSMLMDMKEVQGTLDFNKRYQNVARDQSQMLFREEFMRGMIYNGEKFPGCLDSDYCIGDRDPSWRVYNGFDPAVGVKRGSKFCALIVLGVGSCALHEKCWWVIDIKRDQWTLPQQVSNILYYGQHYDAQNSIIEANAYQGGLYQQVRQTMDEKNIFLNVNPHYTSRNNKPDPDTGIAAMSTMVQQGKLHIPWKDPASRKAMTTLVDEMITYPGNTTDTVMALWFAWRETMGQAPRWKAANRFDRPQDYSWPQPGRLGMQVIKNPYYEKAETSGD